VIELKVAGPLGTGGEVEVDLEFPPQPTSSSKPVSNASSGNLRIFVTSGNREERTIACAGGFDDESWIKKLEGASPP
jgi:hypothetical protein